jgi:hypothetical protein
MMFVVLYFEGLYKQIKKIKYKKMLEEKKFIYINKKNILECSGNCRSLTEKDQIYEKKNFDNVFSTDEGPINKK